MQLIKRLLFILFNEGIKGLFYKIFLWPQSRFYVKLMEQKKWKSAVIFIEKLMNFRPRNIEYYQDLAYCYKKLENEDLATSILQKGLELKVELVDLMDLIEKKLPPNSFLESKYTYMGGVQNLGCIEHIKKENDHVMKYLTKISPKSNFNTQKLFYLNVYKNFPELKEITPKFINIMELYDKNLTLLTMEKVEGSEPLMNKENIREVIKLNKIISSIKYGQIKNHLPELNLDRKVRLLKNKYSKHPISALQSFVSIHKKSTNQQLFHLIYKRLRAENYSSATVNYIKKLENIILNHQLFNLINPEIHYSLQHGDIKWQNMIIDKKCGKLYIIDWGNMRIGPSWVDLAGFLGQLKQPFKMINDYYLLNTEASSNLEPIEKIFFVYTLIVTWFIVFNQSELDQNIESYLAPAVSSIDLMLLDIMNKDRSFQQDNNYPIQSKI